jgi:hypothetical protein
VALALTVVLPAHAAFAQQATATLTFGASFANRTSLHTSSSSLDVPAGVLNAATPVVVGSIEFEAAGRTSGNGEIIMTVEALREIRSLAGGGTAASAVAIAFSGGDDGVVPGVLSGTPQVAGRWIGPGMRRGRLVFTLTGTGRLSAGVIPLRFVLSAP